MAAVLCGGIGKLCTGCCECVGQVCMLPFKMCGACCDGLGQCCSESCTLITNCCSSRFCCHIFLTIALMAPPIFLGLSDVPNAIGGCAGSLWLLVFWLLCVVHIVAAFYMAYAIEKDESILPQSGSSGQHSYQEGSSRMWKLFCYDYWMAAYILVVLGYFGWLLLGGMWYASGTMDDVGSCSENIGGIVGIAYGFGWAYVFLGGCGICCSVCCGVFMDPPGRRGPPPMQQSAQQPVADSAKPTTIPMGNSTTAPPAAAVPPQAAAAAMPDNDKPGYSQTSGGGDSTTKKPGLMASLMTSVTAATRPPATPTSPPEVEVEAVPVKNPPPTAPMASAVPY